MINDNIHELLEKTCDNCTYLTSSKSQEELDEHCATCPLVRLMRGEWCNCEEIQEVLKIDFATGLHLFEFARTATWNPAPLNGQKVTCQFKLREVEVDE